MEERVHAEQQSSWEVRWKGLTFKVPDKTNGRKQSSTPARAPCAAGRSAASSAVRQRQDHSARCPGRPHRGARKGRVLEGDIVGCERCAYVQQEEAFVGVLDDEGDACTRPRLWSAAARRGSEPTRCSTSSG